MGAVFKAEDQSNGQLVALKVIGSALADSPETLRRFRKEGRLLAQVQHPNIANLLEINEEEGIHYLVMEYISGGDLAHLLSGTGRPSETRVLTIAAEVLRGLSERT